MSNTLTSKMLLACQILITKPCTNMGIFNGMYINVTNMCNLVTRYTFSKLSNKFTEYTSCEVEEVAELGQIS
jgi:hypothetical protein